MLKVNQGLRPSVFALAKRQFVALARVEQVSDQVLSPSLKDGAQFYVPFGVQVPTERYFYDAERNQIGQGMFATVFKALDTRTRKAVAVKVINKKKCHKQIYQQEKRVMGQIISSLGVAALKQLSLALPSDMIETEEEVKFVFKLSSGGDLCDDVVDNGGLTEVEARAFMKSIVPALAALHHCGFVHRDIKPENVLLPSNNNREAKYESAVLSDFGYARKITETDPFNNPAGTFGYVAPEVLSSRKYSTACDIWSLGCVLFTAKAAYQPFPPLEDTSGLKSKTSDNLAKRELEAITAGSTEAEWEKEMSQKPFKSTSSEFKDLLEKMLTLDPKERISAEEILDHPWMTVADYVEDTELLQASG